jgi:hypothetical protein
MVSGRTDTTRAGAGTSPITSMSAPIAISIAAMMGIIET